MAFIRKYSLYISETLINKEEVGEMGEEYVVYLDGFMPTKELNLAKILRPLEKKGLTPIVSVFLPKCKKGQLW